jgi:hypothetical protein
MDQCAEDLARVSHQAEEARVQRETPFGDQMRRARRFSNTVRVRLSDQGSGHAGVGVFPSFAGMVQRPLDEGTFNRSKVQVFHNRNGRSRWRV